MFNKIKSIATGVANKVKGFVSAKETEMTAKAHAVLDGTVAEAYVDTGVKILIAVVIGALLLTLLYNRYEVIDNGNDSVNEYSCGSKGHHCDSKETHDFIVGLEKKGCPHCGSHSCKSFYTYDELVQILTKSSCKHMMRLTLEPPPENP